MGRTIFSFQYLRGIACLLVALIHFEPHLNISLEKTGIVLDVFKYYAYAGVDIFFMISGFVIWLTTAKLNNSQAWFNTKIFLAKRIIRVYLPYIPIILMVLMVYYSFFTGYSKTPLELTKIITLFPYPFYLHPFPFSWTLSYEVIFYLSFSLFILFAFSTKQRLWIIGLLFCVILFFNIYTELYLHINRTDFLITYFSSLDRTLVSYLSSPFWLDFSVGIIIAHLWMTNHAIYRWIDKWFTLKIISIIIIGLFLVLWYFKINLDIGDAWNLRRVLTFLPLFFIFLVLLLHKEAREKPEKGQPFLMMLGEASYLIYLVHTIFFTALHWLRVDQYMQKFGLWSIPFMYGLFTVMLVGCFVITRYIEIPAYRYTINKVLGKIK